MAIKLIANYSKRLGLPGYSSHQFSVSIETELVATDDISAESQRIYQLLQTNVDEQILHTGFVPPAGYGMEAAPDCPTHPSATAGSGHPPSWQSGPAWRCSDKQRDLILKIVEEHDLNKNDIEALSVERFGKGVRTLNKVEASGLIDELLETYAGNRRQDS
ncbi:MAG: hypothetical protein EOP84_20385, partial [Verrucomicrobiaceae bacterium]